MTFSFSKGKASLWDGKDLTLDKPRYGYNWFFWFPRLHWNGGFPWKREVTDISCSWLMFWLGVTIWRGRVSQDKADSLSCALGCCERGGEVK